MPRFPKARRKNKSISVFEQAHRFYGQPFEVTSSRDLADSMAEWADLAPPERTFTLTHLLYLNLMAQAGTHLLLRKVWDAVEDLADELEDQAEHDDRDRDREDAESDDEDEEPDYDGDADEPEEEDLEADDGEPAEAVLEPASPLQHAPSSPPPGVTIPAAVTPPVLDDEDEFDDHEQGDGYEPDDLDEGDER